MFALWATEVRMCLGWFLVPGCTCYYFHLNSPWLVLVGKK